MGKDEVKEEDPYEEATTSNESTSEIITVDDTSEEESPNKKKNVDDLRKVIKIDTSEESKDDKPQEQKEKKVEPSENESELTTRESLEQKRAILQSIKDFDFQIKKNQEDLTLLHKKIDNVVKDLDDLVSLYEIVSEQMNPFVGLSKVTKKRIDALENFTKEIELLKDRTGELESFAERSGVQLKKPSVKEFSEKMIEDAYSKDLTEEEQELIDAIEDDVSMEISTEETQHPMSIDAIDNNAYSRLSDLDWDIILERAFSDMFPDNKIDMIIDEFIESLKG